MMGPPTYLRCLPMFSPAYGFVCTVPTRWAAYGDHFSHAFSTAWHPEYHSECHSMHGYAHIGSQDLSPPPTNP